MAHTSSFPHGFPEFRRGERQRSYLGLALGVAFSAGLFLGISRFDRNGPVELPPEIADLRAVAIQEPPPPPPELHRELEPLAETLTGIEAAASESPVQLAVTPPDLEALLPPPPVAPPANIQMGQLYANLKPRMDSLSFQDRIFQVAEVDQIPRALNRVAPRVPSYVRGNAKTLRTTLIFIVDASGEIRNVRLAASSGNTDFDAIIMENIHEWTFSPAVKRGQKVRCLLQQAVTIKWSNESMFSL